MTVERRVALTIGVTGTREMGPALADRLRPAVAAVLRRAREVAPPGMAPRIVSPLAEGADRLVAAEALKLGYTLLAPLPFKQADYERDFGAAVEPFRDLLARADEVVELDGKRGAAETASYEAVGRYVVRHCRLLLALWDGETTGKRGGTAEITLFAARTGVPTYWIPLASASPARWIVGEAQWHARWTLDTDADTALAAHLN